MAANSSWFLVRGFFRLDPRITGDAQLLLLDLLTEAALQCRTNGLGTGLFAVGLRHHLVGHLARTETGHLDRFRHPLEALLNVAFDIGDGNDHFDTTLQRAGRDYILFLILHENFLKDGNGFGGKWYRCSPIRFDAWCEGRDSNSYALRRWNLNPVRLPIPPPSRRPDFT
jgi:hypothetical protein